MGRILLVAAALDLQTGLTPLVDDSEMRALLELEESDHAVVHTLTVAGSA